VLMIRGITLKILILLNWQIKTMHVAYSGSGKNSGVVSS